MRSCEECDRIVEIRQTCADIADQIDTRQIRTEREAVRLLPIECLQGIHEGQQKGVVFVE